MSRSFENIRLSEDKIKSVPDFLNFAIEYLIFYRWVYFKNRPRGNLFFVRAFIMFFVFLSLYYATVGDLEFLLEGIEVGPFFIISVCAMLGYFSMLNVFQKKTSYCLLQKNRIFDALTSKNYKKANLYMTSFSLDVLSTDLWAHGAFSSLFWRTVEMSFREYLKSEKKVPEAEVESKVEYFFSKCDQGSVSISEIRKYLIYYHEDLFNNLQNENSHGEIADFERKAG